MNPPQFTPEDFAHYLSQAESIPLIGGQAVAWWARRYHDQLDTHSTVTSRDIDFWAGREEMEAFADRTGITLDYPHRYAMTVLSGSAEVSIAGRPSCIEFLHTVPGIDQSVDRATITQEWNGRTIRVLDPISLILCKLHALRNFDQRDRQDAFHLVVCVKTARPFLQDAFASGIRNGLWYCERLIEPALHARNQKVEAHANVDLMAAIPVTALRAIPPSADGDELLNRFLNIRLPQVLSKRSRDTPNAESSACE